MALDPDAVPSSLRDLLPLAEEWGIGDDFDREAKVDTASRSDLEALTFAIDRAPDALWSWLTGPDSASSTVSSEYVAFTNMTMAADSARLRLSSA